MSSGVCPFTLTKNLLYHTLLTGVLLLVAIAQGILLDVYIISNDHTAIANYFWLIPDFLMVFGFVAAMSSGYRNCKLEQHPPNINVEGKRKEEGTRWIKVERILGKHAMPFYVWMVYSVLLVAKVVIIFKSEIPNKINTTDALSPQLLKIVLSSSCIVFALLVEGQATIGASSERETYIRSLAQGTSMEILDSVTFISLLIQSESGFLFPDYMENIIIAFSCINFFLPGIALVKLSRSNYGNSAVCLISSIIYKMSHLWLINFSYFVIRVHLWAGLAISVSPFVIKNLCNMFVTMKSVWGDLKRLRVIMHDYMNRKRRVHGNSGITPVVDLNTGNGSSEWMPAGSDRFEEIDLKSDIPRSNADAVDK
ncbi:uncharacterized protein LOC122261011 isoform X2 [Penaeus japonicus]|nr:uncharacterized protein LOC122261011 isoform X2 [Penaeus japonicus]XP_042884420.1 uncharacterized protein LOC122261011 isoform X2 [Penaeus japonicus]